MTTKTTYVKNVLYKWYNKVYNIFIFFTKKIKYNFLLMEFYQLCI